MTIRRHTRRALLIIGVSEVNVLFHETHLSMTMFPNDDCRESLTVQAQSVYTECTVKTYDGARSSGRSQPEKVVTNSYRPTR